MGGQKTVVVGAGPVGCLAAIYAARRGDDVEIYELRGDLRDPTVTPLNFTRSINLALSERGINAIRHARRPGLLECILENTIPMHGRMIHGSKPAPEATVSTPDPATNKSYDDNNDQNGSSAIRRILTEVSQQYDVHGRAIRAADRGELNMNLLDELEDMHNVRFFFNHKLVGADFANNVAWFEERSSSASYAKGGSSSMHKSGERAGEVQVKFDFMIGADGAHSAVRYHLMKYARMDYQQEYIDTLWCEFRIEPRQNLETGEDEFKLSPNHLHIWPGGSFMFIAIPSTDKSFTCTLFLSASVFATLDVADDDAAVVEFFQENFPGVVPDLIPADDLVEQYASNPHLPLISIKCAPYHYAGSVVILGDAAHAMVPFYGQGMNAGLEDVRVLYDHMDSLIHPLPLTYIRDDGTSVLSKAERTRLRAAALERYTQKRHPDAVAICQLALANYAEMSAHVRSPLYLLRKAVEEQLSAYLPSLGWETQYARVSFGNKRYSEVMRLAAHQQAVLTRVGAVMLAGLFGSAAWFAVRFAQRTNMGFGSVWERLASLWPSRS